MATRKTATTPTTPEVDTITVRLCVGQDSDGNVTAFGRSGWSDSEIQEHVADYEGYEAIRFVDLELPKAQPLVLKAKVIG